MTSINVDNGRSRYVTLLRETKNARIAVRADAIADLLAEGARCAEEKAAGGFPGTEDRIRDFLTKVWAAHQQISEMEMLS
jgi:hypothetical protein